VHDDHVGCSADRDRGPDGCSDRRENDGRSGYKSASGTDRQNGRAEDGTPNSHDCLHASTEVDSLRTGRGGHARHGSRTDHRQSSADYG
jgi:hypothetical protein